MDEKRVVIKEQSLKNLADQVRAKAGTNLQYDIDEMTEAISKVGTPELEELYTEENGEFIPTTYGYSKVTVSVHPETEEITITKAGIYVPTTYGYKKVVVDVPTRNFEEEVF